jgi:hypothetical protein
MSRWRRYLRNLKLWWCRHAHRRHHTLHTHTPLMQEVTCSKCHLRWGRFYYLEGRKRR